MMKIARKAYIVAISLTIITIICAFSFINYDKKSLPINEPFKDEIDVAYHPNEIKKFTKEYLEADFLINEQIADYISEYFRNHYQEYKTIIALTQKMDQWLIRFYELHKFINHAAKNPNFNIHEGNYFDLLSKNDFSSFTDNPHIKTVLEGYSILLNIRDEKGFYEWSQPFVKQFKTMPYIAQIEFANILIIKEDFKSAYKILKKIKNIKKRDIASQIQYYLLMARIRENTGDIKQALHNYRKFFALLTENTDNNYDKIMSLVHYAGFLANEKKLPELKKVLEKMVTFVEDMEKSEYGTELYDSYISMAILYQSLYDKEDAIAFYQQAYDISFKFPELKYSYRILRDVNNLGKLYFNIGDNYTAIEQYNLIINHTEKYFNGKYLLNADLYNNLAASLYLKKDFEEAYPLYFKALKIKLLFYEEDSLEISKLNHNIGSLLSSMEKYMESIDMMLKSFNVRKDKYGINHTETLSTATALGYTYFAIKEYAHALYYLKICYKASAKLYGRKHNVTLNYKRIRDMASKRLQDEKGNL